MSIRTLAAVALATLLAAACSSGSSDPEVKGVVVERSDVATEPAVEDPGTPEAPATAREAPAVGDRGLATLATDEDTDEPAPPPARPRDPATTAPPSPTTEPTVAPARLAEAAGNTYTWTQPEDPPEEGSWWVEASSLPPQDPDGDPWNGARVAARDVDAAEGQDTASQPVRRATCDPWVEAPHDRPVEGTGTVTVELTVNGDVVATGTYRFDGTLGAGERRGFERVGDATVDAREGDEVACAVRFDAD